MLRALWSGERVHHRGRFYTLEDYDILPKPVQRPCPIWIAVNPRQPMARGPLVERALRRVVRLGDGYMTDGVAPDEFRRRWDFMQETADRQGRDLSRFETCLHGMININEDRRAAYDESKHYFQAYYPLAPPSEDVIRVWLAHGPPEECAEVVRGWLGHGHQHAGAALHRDTTSRSDPPFRRRGPASRPGEWPMNPNLRDFLRAVRETGPDNYVEVTKPLDPYLEIGIIQHKLAAEGRNPVIYCPEIKGSSLPLVTNMFGSFELLAWGLGCDPRSMSRVEIYDVLRKKLAQREDPVWVDEDDAPVKEKKFIGDDVDLSVLPIIHNSKLDAGKYIGAGFMIARWPDTGVPNAGIYRHLVMGGTGSAA